MSSIDYALLRTRLDAAIRSVCPSWLRAQREDLIQLGLMAVMRLEEKGEELGSLSASYVRKVAYSAVVDEIRRHRRRKEVPLDTTYEPRKETPTTSVDPDRRYTAREIGGTIRDCIGTLARPRQFAVTLYLLGYQRLEIAQRMGWDRKRAANLVFRGLSDLRECLRLKEVTP